MTHSVEDKTQDAPASVDTTYTISVGEGFEGVLADRSDEDWIRVEMVEKVNSALTFSPDAGGVYFLSAGAYIGNPTQDNSGRYQVAVYESDASLVLTGTRNSDYYFNVRLKGSPGNDQLRGGPDDDMLDGGEGDDAFVIAAGGGNDAVLDFGNGEDRIDLAAFADIQSLEDLNMQQQENAVVIDLSAHGGGTVTLQGFDMADVMDAHFVFYMDEAAATA